MSCCRTIMDSTVSVFSTALQRFRLMTPAEEPQSTPGPAGFVGAPRDEVLALGGDGGLCREGDVARLQHDLIAQDLLLAAALAEWPPPKQHLVQHHAHGPHIHLLGENW